MPIDTLEQFVADMQPRIGGEPIGGRITSDLNDALRARLTAAKDRCTERSPIDVPGIGAFDYDALSREKLLTAAQAIYIFDLADPLTVHSVEWTLANNTKKVMTAAAFRLYFYAVTQRAQPLQDACGRAKDALDKGQAPDPADLALLFPPEPTN